MPTTAATYTHVLGISNNVPKHVNKVVFIKLPVHNTQDNDVLIFSTKQCGPVQTTTVQNHLISTWKGFYDMAQTACTYLHALGSY